jgi:NitT/TauT family transport system permease protein
VLGGLWEVIGRLELLTSDLPPPSAIVATATDPGFGGILWENALATLREAASGYLIGNGAAIALAAIVVLAPAVSKPLMELAVLIQSVPLIALVPLIATSTLRASAPVIAAVIAVSFTTFLTTEAGLLSASKPLEDVFRVFGAGRLTRLRRLQAPVAVPGICEGLKIAAPASLVGAILGEWFGASSGIGPLIISSLQNYQIPQLWAAALVAALPAIAVYTAFDGVQRRAARVVETAPAA